MNSTNTRYCLYWHTRRCRVQYLDWLCLCYLHFLPMARAKAWHISHFMTFTIPVSQVLFDMGRRPLYTSHSHTVLPSFTQGPKCTVINVSLYFSQCRDIRLWELYFTLFVQNVSGILRLICLSGNFIFLFYRFVYRFISLYSTDTLGQITKQMHKLQRS